MKRLLIVLSLAANLALGAALWHRSAQASPSSAKPATPNTNTTSVATTEAWAHLTHAKDDADWVARLREAGFPPAIVRALTMQRIREKHRAELTALTRKDDEIPYWRTSGWFYDLGPESRAKRRALERAISDELKQLLGPDAEYPEGPYAASQRKRNYGDIPQGKVDAIKAITKDYSELAQEIREAAKGFTLREDREKLAYLEREERADLEQLLTPAELEEYDLRNHPSSRAVTFRLRFLDSTEQEFIALYRIQRDFDDRYGRDNLTGAQADARKEAEKQLAPLFEQALGPQRYAEYHLTTDGNYSNTRSFVSWAELPVERTKDLIKLQRTLVQQAEALRADKSLSVDDLKAQLTSLEKSADTQIAGLIGSDKVDRYKKRAGGWLTKLAPASKPSTR